MGVANSSHAIQIKNPQGQILAVWILAVGLPDSDLNFAVDFCGGFFLFFSKAKEPEKFTKKKTKFTWDFVQKNSLGFLQKPSLENSLTVELRDCPTTLRTESANESVAICDLEH